MLDLLGFPGLALYLILGKPFSSAAKVKPPESSTAGNFNFHRVSESSMSIQYLLDEHIAPLYRTQLVRQAPTLVVRIIGDPDAPPKGTLDPEILI